MREQIEAFATAIKIHSPPATANMNPIEMRMANTLLAHLPARDIEEHTLGDFPPFSPSGYSVQSKLYSKGLADPKLESFSELFSSA